MKKFTQSKINLLTTPEGNMIMNESNLKLVCIKEDLYEQPQFNKKLYLQHKLINKIQNLAPYKNLKALYLENNNIRTIENIECLTQLQCLFLHSNIITKIQNINCPRLKILNLSENKITKIQGLSHLSELQSLTLSHNLLTNFESIEHLEICSNTITNLDLSNNEIELDERMIGLFANLKCLYLMGNMFTRDMSHYRRRMIAELPNLLYLDQKGVETEERMKAKAWLDEGEQGLNRVIRQLDDLKIAQKGERSKQLMKDIDVHRQRKINLFKSAIEDCKNQIKKLVNMSSTTNMNDFYMNKIQQEQQKINTFYDSIISIQQRMGKTVLSEREIIELPILESRQGVLFQNYEDLIPILEQSTDGSSPKIQSEENSQHSEVSNGEPGVYYDELD